MHKHQEFISRFPNIMKELTYLEQKVRMIAFLELLFTCGKDERNLPFSKISATCCIETIDVELLVMKAMSLELVKGTIDEVSETVKIDWILPRYLSKGHLEVLVGRLGDWEAKMDDVIKLVENNAEELLT